ncbi:hypothetical protein N7E81_06545 [Reichenbachiella carrageenanivorans]|uniref:Uncharacterized protein n=1 Tax=Reichenbachiella carrageenanivorans TaxID=2979869 RepID=A0ABY6D3M4_9BACT|nr:hypothetical protein [Reichenbachiella carrageenanivorans]UXX80757.1 hypothetical protein N7E81_06545 [Reichenbachiella carrageenanivorans]
MSNKKEILDKRELLLSEEKKLMAHLENEASTLETQVENSLKTLAVIGAGVIAVTLLYKLIAPSSSPKTKTKRSKDKKATSRPSAVTTSVISIAIQKLLPLAIEKISMLNSKSQKDEQAAESTTR